MMSVPLTQIALTQWQTANVIVESASVTHSTWSAQTKPSVTRGILQILVQRRHSVPKALVTPLAIHPQISASVKMDTR